PAEDVHAVSAGQVPLALLRPGNAAVLLVLAGVHLLALVIWVPVTGGLFYAAFILLFLYMMVIGHLANIVEEIGVQERDELPAPLRGMEWGADVWTPFVNCFGAIMLCYLPAVVASGPQTLLTVSVPLALAGTFCFPAVFLTLSTSGSLW